MTQEEYEKKIAKAKQYAENARKKRLEKISSIEYRQKQLERLKEAKKRQYERQKQKDYTPIKKKQKTYKKTKGKYYSIFTDDIKTCVITGAIENVVVHHIFGSNDKVFSEKYGFTLPLRYDWHTLSKYSIHEDKELDLKYKRTCEDYWINTLHKSKEEWLQECSCWY